MKKKEAIKAKRKEIRNLNNQLIDVMADMMKISLDRPNKQIGKLFNLSFKAFAISNQLKLVRSLPIPSKKFKKGGTIIKPNIKEEETIKVPVGSIVINPEDSERILKDNGFKRCKDECGYYSNIEPSKPILLSKENIADVEKSAKELQLAIKEKQLIDLKKEIKELKKKIETS